MPVTPSWRPLPSTPATDVPPLLVSMEGGSADYTVRITDMANVWVETLDRKRICMRAWDLNTSIDPSDTPENMAKFLTSVRSSLDATQKGHDQTSLALLPGTSGEVGEEGLILKISCEIPGLQTLRWTMQLRKAPISAIATSVVLPLLQAQLARAQEVEALTELVHRKDSVITKLVDKLEATGTGLENIFNSLSTSLSGRKKVSRAAAGEKIRGLAPFNQHEWQQEMRSAADEPPDVTSLLNRVFSGSDVRHESSMEVEETPGLDQWWHGFRGTKQVSLQSRPKMSPNRAASPPSAETEVAGGDDDFQIQSTPPGLKTSRSRASDGAAAAAEEDSTASEDEDGSPLPSSATTTRQKGAGATASARLGTIGGKRQPSKQASPIPEPATPARPGAQAAHDSETASEPDDDPTAALPEPPSLVPAKSPARKVGLGRIGGPKPKAAPEERVVQSTSPDEGPKQRPAPRKLGIIGKRGPDKAPETGLDNGRGRSREAAQLSREAPRETSQERADRKRDELKRELEKKAAAGPAKKKRKF